MSGLPTLLRKGFIVPPEGADEGTIDRLNDMTGVSYISEFIRQRTQNNGVVKVPPERPGDRYILLKSDTGSGKSTVLPAKLYEHFYRAGSRKTIAVTQPRIITTIDTPRIIVSIPANSFLKMDKNIGYSCSISKRIPKEKGILFCTVGTLRERLKNTTSERFVKAYQFIIIDEVHERDMQTDETLFLLKKLINENWENPACPLIILASATFEERIFLEYFDIRPEHYIQIRGKTFPIEKRFPKYDIPDYIRYATNVAKKIHLENLDELVAGNPMRDIIIFVSGMKDAQEFEKQFHIFNSQVLNGTEAEYRKALVDVNDEVKKYLGGSAGRKPKCYVLPIVLNKRNFEMGGKEYANLFSDTSILTVPLYKLSHGDVNMDNVLKKVNPSRRIIIGTNLAETGVTIPTLKYCIDTGFAFPPEYHPYFDCMSYSVKNISQGSRDQRMGRVGRVGEGVWYPCYSSETSDSMSSDALSQVVLDDPAKSLLGILIKEKEVKEVETHAGAREPLPEEYYKFRLSSRATYRLENTYRTSMSSLDFIELPSSSAMASATEKLHSLGYINDEMDITFLGFIANKIKFISLESARMILAGYQHGANILDLVTIASFLYYQRSSIFSRKFSMINFLKTNREKFDFYNNVIIGDEFVNFILIFNVLHKLLNSRLIRASYNSGGEGLETTQKKEVVYPQEFEKWCTGNQIQYEGLIKVISLRDTLIESLLEIGMNPYYNSLGVTKSDHNLARLLKTKPSIGIDEIRKIKHCIYDGFKLKLVRKEGADYVIHHKGIPIRVESSMLRNNAKYAIVSNYEMTEMENGVYGMSSRGYVSIMDNYVNVDEEIFIM